MSRLEWVLGIVLVVLLGVVIALSFVFWFKPEAPQTAATDSAAIIAERADDIAPTSVFKGQTAKIAFAAAQKSARQWQSDANLYSATATWPQGASEQDLMTGETVWVFTFFAPSTNSEILVSVIENEATLGVNSPSPQALHPMHASGWELDSSEVIKILLDQGGREFMRVEGITIMTMTLSTDSGNGRIEWIASLIATQSGRSLTLTLDATSGDIIDIELV